MKEIWKFSRTPVLFVLVLWIIELFAQVFDVRMYWLGILPRAISGIPGIFTSAFIHGSSDHLLSNTLPLIVVGTGLFYFYKEIAFRVLALIWLFTGFWVWLAAREEYHIGASGLIYGLVCFLFFSGILRRDTRLLAVSLLVTFLYGSMVWGILPVDQTISWESHLYGSVAGIFGAVMYKAQGPPRQKAQWEIDEENERALSEQAVTAGDGESGEQLSPPPSITVTYHYREEKNDSNNQQDKSGNISGS